MPPNILTNSLLGTEFTKDDSLKREETDILEEEVSPTEQGFFQNIFKFKTGLIWVNIISITAMHAVALYTLFTLPYLNCKMTLLWGFLLGQAGGFGVTGGVHRLWCHRSYKAKWPLRVILILCYSLAGQNTVFDWVRDHRVHHKYTETAADPHDSNRGFFFAHVGWLMMRKHPEVLRRGRQIDMSDVLADSIVRFNHKYFVPMKLLCCFIIPTVVPVYFWDEDWSTSILAQVFLRYTMGLNFTWFVNSAAHMWGTRPYDKTISPTENLGVAIVAMGEGWHNYHHIFPWDYKAAELGDYTFNTTTMLIDMFAKIGWAYDLKQPSIELVKKVALKHGDQSHGEWPEVPEPKAD